VVGVCGVCVCDVTKFLQGLYSNPQSVPRSKHTPSQL